MNNKPLVSVIIPFFNSEKFFQETIESVIKQTYDAWELLLVDDGSSDSSTEIALRYAQKYSDKVYYFEHDGHANRGKSSTRNLGINKAKGEYVAFLDADDVWLPQKLERQVEIFRLHPTVGMVYGSTKMWFSWSAKPKDAQRDRGRILGIQPDTLVEPPKLATLYLQAVAETPGTCAVLLRHEVIDKVGGFEETIQHLYEDQVFFMKVCLQIPVFIESGCWDLYRQHPDSSWQIAQKKQHIYHGGLHPSRLIFLNWVEHYLSEQKFKDPEVWQALQQQLWPYRHPLRYYLSLNYFVNVIKLTVRQIVPFHVRRQLRNSFSFFTLMRLK